jgi:AcrR family transcriptional regulator
MPQSPGARQPLPKRVRSTHAVKWARNSGVIGGRKLEIGSSMAETQVLDRRVRRTRRLLSDSLLTLARERDISTITIHQITEHADINRATFYQHFRDKDDLFAQAIDQLIADLRIECQDVLTGTDLLDAELIHPSVVGTFRQIRKHADLFRQLLGKDGSMIFATRLRQHLEALFLESWKAIHPDITPTDPPLGVRARTAASGTIGIVSWWLEQPDPETPETIAAWSWRLLRTTYFTDA